MTSSIVELQYPLATEGLGLYIQPQFDLHLDGPPHYASFDSTGFGAFPTQDCESQWGQLGFPDWFILDPNVGNCQSIQDVSDMKLEYPQSQVNWNPSLPSPFKY